ncbi:hypothetical protein [Herbaspirillum sp. YR522]|uniref:hypothetical protein n=1 Tax=Herbaspirillum sp. YR522 TaxID=1144342 RepID=UPI00026F90E7|nr:hypothetical protein [Herbaspirillum sp. YR522]EJN07991.1 hypothetical protein PMI40_01542 [Herbaspirillum sp. YR522]
MKTVSRSCLDAASGGLIDFGFSAGRGRFSVFMDLGPVINLPFVGSLRFGNNVRVVHRIF